MKQKNAISKRFELLLSLCELVSLEINKLNLDEKMINALNSVLNFSFISSRVLQSNVDVDNSEMSFKLMRFKNKNFTYQIYLDSFLAISL